MNNILKYAVDNNASDIHITQDKPAWVRIRGEFKRTAFIVPINAIHAFIEKFLPDMEAAYHEFAHKKNTNPIDGAFEFMGRRLRVNIYYSMSGINIA